MSSDIASYRTETDCPDHGLDGTSERARHFPTSRAQLRAIAEKPPAHGQYRRQSIFKEVDVDGFTDEKHRSTHAAAAPQKDYLEEDYFSLGNAPPSQQPQQRLYVAGDMDRIQVTPRSSTLTRLSLLAFIMVILVPGFYEIPLLGKAGPSIIGAKAGVIERTDMEDMPSRTGPWVAKRSITSTNVCNRWSQQSALVNGTIYIFGGHATQEQDQVNNTWTNDFLSMDVTKDFDISDPPQKGLPQPSGIPATSNGFLWHSYDTLFLYGGEVSDSPRAYPPDYSLWAYDIKNSKWIEHRNPKTSAGNNSEDGGQPVQRSGEGAGVNVPELGRGYYFAGHLDGYTTKDWSLSVPRVYLKSLLEFTFPGYTNDGVESLRGGKEAGEDGVWRNITGGGIQETGRFTDRADSALVYVPGFGVDGILVNLGGGTDKSFTQMNVIDVYDIATSTWYKQSTSGKYPSIRVNPCAVAASAPDGTSTNIYMYGGQDLKEKQTQYGDMWILTIPSFSWIEVDTSEQSVPPARVGHTCHMFDGQIVSIGGYNTAGLSCDSGVYVFNATDLSWTNTFKAIGGGDPKTNPQNQQVSQQKDRFGLSGSYGYQVPEPVQAVIGGGPTGGATVTAPAQSIAPTAGPIKTGKPITYTVQGTYTITAADGSVVTETGSTSSTTAADKGRSGPNVAAIVAGVVAGFFFVLASYLGFCAWVYRRQLALYKNHVAMTQRNALTGGGPNEKISFLSDQTGRDRLTDKSSTAAATSAANSGAGSSIPPVPPIGSHHGSGEGMPIGGNSTANSSSEDLMRGQEPTFVGVLLNPRRSLRVINRD